MSERMPILFLQLIFALSMIAYGVQGMLGEWKLNKLDEPFSKYQCMADCVRLNWNKRDPYQYCRAIRRKVRKARWRKRYGGY